MTVGDLMGLSHPGNGIVLAPLHERLGDVRSEILREIVATWARDCDAEGHAPSAQALTPETYLRYSEFCCVCGVLANGQVEIRIAGERLNALYGRSLRRALLSQLERNGESGLAYGQVQNAITQATAQYYRGPGFVPGKPHLWQERVALPFLGAACVSKLLIAIDLCPHPRATA